MKLPKARTENLLEQNLEKETLIYDLLIDKAFNLNETLSIIYKACGQNETFDDLKQKHRFTDDFIYLALDELKRENLLAEDYQSPFANVNRREVIRKVGLATMLALPLIAGLVAPTAANAASGDQNPVSGSDIGVGCNTLNGVKSGGGYCQSGFCVDTWNGSACCNTFGGTYTLRSGGSFNSIGGSDDPFPVYDAVPPNSPAPTCAEKFDCCDGSQTPYGTCTYESMGDQEYEGLVLVRVICNCTCP